jgi:hypothetical protein
MDSRTKLHGLVQVFALLACCAALVACGGSKAEKAAGGGASPSGKQEAKANALGEDGDAVLASREEDGKGGAPARKMTLRDAFDAMDSARVERKDGKVAIVVENEKGRMDLLFSIENVQGRGKVAYFERSLTQKAGESQPRTDGGAAAFDWLTGLIRQSAADAKLPKALAGANEVTLASREETGVMPNPLGQTLADAYLALSKSNDCKVERADGGKVRFVVKGDRGRMEIDFTVAKTTDAGVVAIVEGLAIESSRSDGTVLKKGAEAHAMLLDMIRENPPAPPAKTGDAKQDARNDFMYKLEHGGLSKP